MCSKNYFPRPQSTYFVIAPIVFVFAILTIAPLISESLPGNTGVTMATLQQSLGGGEAPLSPPTERLCS